jgi:Cu2+-exporting ATPase
VAEQAGQGVTARWAGLTVALHRPEPRDGRTGGALVTALAIEGRPTRLIHFADRLRPDTTEALAQLSAMGIDGAILSGDNADAVAEAARETGLPARAEASPQDKRDAIDALRRDGAHVLMVGDGLNDGPALAAAHASMAPGSASDVGRQAADFVFLGDSLLAVPRAVAAARRTMRVVRQNFVLAIGYNVLAVPLAIFGYITPLLAAIAMSTSSLIVIANSLRLTRAAR